MTDFCEREREENALALEIAFECAVHQKREELLREEIRALRKAMPPEEGERIPSHLEEMMFDESFIESMRPKSSTWPNDVLRFIHAARAQLDHHDEFH